MWWCKGSSNSILKHSSGLLRTVWRPTSTRDPQMRRWLSFWNFWLQRWTRCRQEQRRQVVEALKRLVLQWRCWSRPVAVLASFGGQNMDAKKESDVPINMIGKAWKIGHHDVLCAPAYITERQSVLWSLLSILNRQKGGVDKEEEEANLKGLERMRAKQPKVEVVKTSPRKRTKEMAKEKQKYDKKTHQQPSLYRQLHQQKWWMKMVKVMEKDVIKEGMGRTIAVMVEPDLWKQRHWCRKWRRCWRAWGLVGDLKLVLSDFNVWTQLDRRRCY